MEARSSLTCAIDCKPELIGHHGAFGKAIGIVGETGKCRDVEILRDVTSVNQQSVIHVECVLTGGWHVS